MKIANQKGSPPPGAERRAILRDEA